MDSWLWPAGEHFTDPFILQNPTINKMDNGPEKYHRKEHKYYLYIWICIKLFFTDSVMYISPPSCCSQATLEAMWHCRRRYQQLNLTWSISWNEPNLTTFLIRQCKWYNNALRRSSTDKYSFPHTHMVICVSCLVHVCVYMHNIIYICRTHLLWISPEGLEAQKLLQPWAILLPMVVVHFQFGDKSCELGIWCLHVRLVVQNFASQPEYMMDEKGYLYMIKPVHVVLYM